MAPPAVRFRGGTVAVSSPDIASLTLVKPLPALARVYIGPWIPAYILSYYAFYHAYDTYIKSIGESVTPLLSSSVSRRWRVFFSECHFTALSLFLSRDGRVWDGRTGRGLRVSCPGAGAGLSSGLEIALQGTDDRTS